MLPVRTSTSVTVGASPVTLYSFTPGGNGTVAWFYDIDNVGLTGRAGMITAKFDTSANSTQYWDESTLAVVESVTAPGAPTAALAASGSTNTNGDHLVKIAYVTAYGVTTMGTATGTITVTDTKDISLTAIPTSAYSAVTARNVYMTKAGGATYYYVGQIANNTATTYTIAIADGDLTVVGPTSNTSAQPDTSALTFDVSMSGGVVSLTATSTSGTWTVKTVEIARVI